VGSGKGFEKDKWPPYRYAMQLYVNITNTILVNAFSQSNIVS